VDWRRELPFLRVLADGLEEGVLVIDQEDRIALVSEPMAAMLGQTPETLRALAPDDLVATISAAVDRDTFETWFKPVSCAGVNCTAVYLTVADKITHEWIAANHSEALFVAIAQAFGKAFQVEWLVGRMVQCTHGVPLR